MHVPCIALLTHKAAFKASDWSCQHGGENQQCKHFRGTGSIDQRVPLLFIMLANDRFLLFFGLLPFALSPTAISSFAGF